MDILLKGINELNLEEKLRKAIEVVGEDNKKLADKILTQQGYKTSNIKAHEQLEAGYIEHYNVLIDRLLNGLARHLGFTLAKAEGGDEKPFVIRGKVFYNPRTGRPLTTKEWKLITEAIDKFLHENTKDLAEKMAAENQYLGTILQRLETQGVRIEDVSLGQVKDKIYDKIEDYVTIYDWRDDELYPLDLSMQRLGHDITGINEDVRRDIVSIINNGIVNRETTKEISRDLLEKMAYRNRDWQRICRYESQYNFQTGYLNSELKHAGVDETIYMQAISQPDACPHCKRLLNGKIYILVTDDKGLEKPHDKHAVGYTMLGATNIGKKAAEYEAVIPMHPFCACRWVRIWPEEFKYLEGR